MLYIVMSDSHGNKYNLRKIIEYSKTSWPIDKFIFLGDGIADIISLISDGVLNSDECVIVKGNCDFFSQFDKEIIIEDSNIKIFATHGNKYGVKYGLETIAEAAREIGAKIVLFGHTHLECNTIINDIALINPGSCSSNLQFVLLEIDNNSYYATLFN